MSLSIRMRLISVSAAILIIFGIMSFISLYQISRMGDNTAEINDNWLPSIYHIGNINTATSDFRIADASHILSTDTQNMQAAESDMEALSKLISSERQNYERLISSEEELNTYKKFSKYWDDYLQIHQSMIKHSKLNDNEVALSHYRNGKKSFDEASSALVALLQINAKGSSDVKRSSEELHSFSNLVTIIVGSGVVVILIGFTWWLDRSISRAIVGITACANRLAGGDNTTEIPSIGRRDEVGDLARSIEVFKRNAIENERLKVEQAALKQKAEAEKHRSMNDLADRFEASVESIVQSVSSAATQLQNNAQGLSSLAEQSTCQSNIVASAAEEAGQNIHTVAAASEELASSIKEISRQVEESAHNAANAVAEAERTNTTVEGMTQAAQRIGDVVTLITDIASQTNLLALNATIEAARAGEAGKGFAVVASEVKALATQTGKATDEIATQIAAFRGTIGDAVTAIQSIGQTIQRINEIAAGIAAAVEEQTAATAEIARNVQQAAAGAGEVSVNVGGVTRAAQETGGAAEQVLGAATSLAHQSDRLRTEVEGFIRGIRTA